MNQDFLQLFHFLRPEWFYALIPILIIFVLFLLQKQRSNDWSKICDPELLQHFLVNKGKVRSQTSLFIILIAWIIAVFALAGPSWKKMDSPIFSNQDALVIILKLADSMNAQDLKPSRLERAKHKLTDILEQRQEGQTALVVYAGDAHIVSPLTPDNKTILSFVSVLDSSLMPVAGNNLNQALNVAEKLFNNAGIHQGKILLLADEFESSQQTQLEKTIKRIAEASHQLSIIGVGTEEGAPIPEQVANQTTTQSFAKNEQGNIIISKLAREKLHGLSQLANGVYHDISINDRDIKSVISSHIPLDAQLKQEQQQEKINQLWQDEGAWFVLLILPFALLMFRRGWLVLLVIFITPIPYQPAYSMDWDDLWQRSDQQASESFQQGKHLKAAEKFEDPLWKGSAYYKAEDYQQAIEYFKQDNSIEAKYNLGNSYAKLQQFEQAIKTYDEVLTLNPEHQDALKNKKIVEDILKQQQQNKDKKNQDNQDKNQKKDKQDQQGKDKKQDSSQQDSKQKKDKNESSSKDKPDQKSSEKNQQQQEQQQQKEDDQQQQQAADKNKSEEEKAKQQQAQAKKTEQEKDEDNKNTDSLFSQLSEEQQQAMQQYLNQIQDDPAYLLKRKFYLNSLRKQQNNQ